MRKSDTTRPDQIALLAEVVAACWRLERASALFAEALVELGALLSAEFGQETDAQLNGADRASEPARPGDVRVEIEGDDDATTAVDICVELQKILSYERRFRGQRDRHVRLFLKPLPD